MRALLSCLALTVAGVALSAQGSNEVHVQALLGQARVKRDAGDLRAASEAFARADRVATLDHKAREEWFWVLAAVEPARARTVAEGLLRENPDADAVRDRAIALATDAGDEPGVTRLAEAGAERHPAAALWARRAGESRLRAKQAAAAVPWLRRAAAAADATETDRVLLAISLEASGDAASASRIWESLPPEVWQKEPGWAHSRLRALVKGAPPARAIQGLDDWVRAHPGDESMQLLLADVLARANEHKRALDVLARVKEPSGVRDSLARHARLAESAGDLEAALHARRRLASGPGSGEADRLALARLLAVSGHMDEASTVAANAAASARGCDDQALSLLSSLDTPTAGDALNRAVAAYPATCPAWAVWRRRMAGRLSGDQQFPAALDMLRPVAASAVATDDDRELFGRLLLWTNEPGRAIAVLSPLLLRQPERASAADSLIDAHRLTGQTHEAWRLAQGRLHDPDLTNDRRLSLAGLALERGAIQTARDLAVAARAQDPAVALTSRGIEARALLESRRPADALAVIALIQPADLDEAGTLTWLEATRDVHGRARALELARALDRRASGWPEVQARTALWTAQENGPGAAGALVTGLATLDAARADLLRVEMALLVAEDPAEAVRLTDMVLAAHPPAATRERILDLRISGLAALERHAEARVDLARLIAWRPDDGALRVRDATYHARELRASGELDRALAVMPPADVLTVHDALVRAELVEAVDGVTHADAAYAALAARPDATPVVFLAWSRIGATPGQREDRLIAGRSRFPDDVELGVSLAEAQMAGRRWPAAVGTATAILMRDPHVQRAWEALVAAVAAQPDASVPATVSSLAPQAFSHDLRALLRLAEVLSGAGASPASVEQALAWVRAVQPASAPERTEARLVEARILASRQRWLGALNVLAPLPSAESDPSVGRLRAQVLAWSGRHEEALAAYDAYLRTEPGDLTARREQARTAGWAQKIPLANRLYARLVADHPASAAARAEATAKRLMYAGRWLDAARAYQLWVEIEPDDFEARFDLGEVLTAAGRLREARSVYGHLSEETPPHTLAMVAGRRLARQSGPSIAAFAEGAFSEGYDGQRLLERTESGGRTTIPLFGHAGQTLALSAGSLIVSDGLARHAGSAVRAALSVQPAGSLRLRGTLGHLRAGHTVSEWEGAVDASLLTVDRLYLDVGYFRAPLWENLTTLRDGVRASGPRAGVRFESPDTLLALHLSHGQTGGNDRFVAAGSGSRRVLRGRNEVRLIADAERTSWSHADVRYFSPGQFVRLNAGAEWRSWVHAPRFRADRKDALVLGYLFGVDNRGYVYHQPRARFAIEVKGVAIEATAARIRSDVYRSTDVGLALRIGG